MKGNDNYKEEYFEALHVQADAEKTGVISTTKALTRENVKLTTLPTLSLINSISIYTACFMNEQSLKFDCIIVHWFIQLSSNTCI